jgi:Zn-dependent protease
MTWSFRLIRLFGTDVKVHFTFILLLAFLFVSTGRAEGAEAAWWVTGFFLSLFLCVLLHEFGHILMARRFGIRTPDVILLPIGGVARLERIPEEPRQELLIAVAGPAVTLAIAGLLWGWLWLAGEPAALLPSVAFKGGFATDLLRVNVMLFLFNLLPAFPLDGGRVLRSVLATRMNYVRATRIANWRQPWRWCWESQAVLQSAWLIALRLPRRQRPPGEARAAGRASPYQMMVMKFDTCRCATLMTQTGSDGTARVPGGDNSGKIEGLTMTTSSGLTNGAGLSLWNNGAQRPAQLGSFDAAWAAQARPRPSVSGWTSGSWASRWTTSTYPRPAAVAAGVSEPTARMAQAPPTGGIGPPSALSEISSPR